MVFPGLFQGVWERVKLFKEKKNSSREKKIEKNIKVLILPCLTRVNSVFILADFSQGVSCKKHEFLSRLTGLNSFFILANFSQASDSCPKLFRFSCLSFSKNAKFFEQPVESLQPDRFKTVWWISANFLNPLQINKKHPSLIENLWCNFPPKYRISSTDLKPVKGRSMTIFRTSSKLFLSCLDIV